MNQNLTFIVISSSNDPRVQKTVQNISGIGKILIIDGGPRSNFVNQFEDIASLNKLAKLYGANYLERKYDYAAAQYNFGLSNTNTQWAFIIDSDELLSDELKNWLEIGDFGAQDYFSVKRFNYFLDNKISHGQFRPDWNIRLFKLGAGKYEDRKVHARMEISGKGGRSPGYLEHYTVQSLDSFVMKMLEFSKLEKNSRLKKNSSNEIKSIIRSKMLILPFQPSLRFIYSYWLRLGFLDGHLGYLLARSASYYEILVKLHDITSNE